MSMHIDFQIVFKMCRINNHNNVTQNVKIKCQIFIKTKLSYTKTAKNTNGPKFAGTEKCIYIKYHMSSHA